ncbi:MAG: type I restriction-modification system subunit M N-terminal domain-containing protein [Terrimicrobiaceae bacterium]
MQWIAPSDKDADNAALEKRLWDAVNQPWAGVWLKQSEYSEPVLGLIFLNFLKYISDTFEERRAKLLAGQDDYARPGLDRHLFLRGRLPVRRPQAGGQWMQILQQLESNGG